MKIETNPMCVYLVKNDSKGDKLLFRYPFGNGNGAVKANVNEQCKRSLHRNASLDGAYQSQDQTDFPDDVISSLFAVKMDLCDRKFELKVNNVRFIGHPIQIQTGGSNRKKKPESPSIILINVVFSLDAFARRQIAHCYYDLSKMFGIALGHEEKRCSYLSKQIKSMLAIHDSMASGSDAEVDTTNENKHFEKILEDCTLAQDLKKVYDDMCANGIIKLKVNNWIEVSFCLPHKVHHFYKEGQYFEPDSINKCLKGLRPYHGLLLMTDRKKLLESLPTDSSPSIVRLINMYNPVKSLQTLSADADLTIAQVFNIAGHLIYWGDAIVIFPLCETNMYAIAPNVPTERGSQFSNEFEEKFPGYNLLEVMSEFSLPTSLQYKMCPVEDKSSGAIMVQILIWLLQRKILLQLHTYIYFMPTSKGLTNVNNYSEKMFDNCQPSETPMTIYQTGSESWLQVSSFNSSACSAEELFNSLTDEEQSALMRIPASANPSDFQLLMRLLKQGYLVGEHHLEEIMYLENIRRSQLLQLFDKFKDVLVLVEMEDPAISHFYSH
ncbi:GATOR complex protein NPRL3 [Adelges cooleyi]|uniref:GATOR complex protein NPRL3 n=1 Tax=Adelges cooleyi TaxID=133065 RepID=UPI00217FB987|nr:GATOR complex protein NPRL3 [Adelges cooleyi]